MSNNGIKQATIAYKVDLQGEPLDLEGAPIRISGKKQAIALKQGFYNPNPSLYEIEMYFNDEVEGEQTTTKDITYCPIGILSPWVLDGGHWGMSKTWYNKRIWDYGT